MSEFINREDAIEAMTTARDTHSIEIDGEDYISYDMAQDFIREIPSSTELKIILNRLKFRMKDRDEDNGGEPLNAVDRGYHLAYEHLCEEIDNLLKENENADNN